MIKGKVKSFLMDHSIKIMFICLPVLASGIVCFYKGLRSGVINPLVHPFFNGLSIAGVIAIAMAVGTLGALAVLCEMERMNSGNKRCPQ